MRRKRRNNGSLMWGTYRIVNKHGDVMDQRHVGSRAEYDHMKSRMTFARKEEPGAQWDLQYKPIMSGWRSILSNPRNASSSERKALVKFLEDRGIQTYFMDSLANLRDLKARHLRGDRMSRKLPRQRRNPRMWSARQVASRLRRSGHGRFKAVIRRLRRKKTRRVSRTLFPVIPVKRSRRSLR